jgi:hypothetical protein
MAKTAGWSWEVLKAIVATAAPKLGSDSGYHDTTGLSSDAHCPEDTMDAQEIRLKGFQPWRGNV